MDVLVAPVAAVPSKHLKKGKREAGETVEKAVGVKKQKIKNKVREVKKKVQKATSTSDVAVAAVPSKPLKKGKREAEEAIEKEQKIRNKVHEVKKNVQEVTSTSDALKTKAAVSSVTSEEAVFQDRFTIYMYGFAEKENMKRALREHFETCGKITKISVDYHHLIGSAYIDFTCMESLTKALQLDNSKFRNGDRRLLVNQIKIPKDMLDRCNIWGGRLINFNRPRSGRSCCGRRTGYSSRLNSPF